MSFVRARALRSLQNGLRSSGARPALRSAPSRMQLQTKRYASGHGEHKESSDIPWIIGSVLVTVPSCYFLWPSGNTGHHDAHGDHESHEAEHAEAEESAPEEESTSQEESPKDDEAPKDEEAPKDDSAEDKDESSEKSESQESSEGSDSSESSGPKGNSSGVAFKGKLKPDSPGASDTRKVESDSKGANKKRIDSGLQKDLTQGPTVGGSADESDPTSQAAKQKGVSNTQTRHSIPIHEDPEKSKKADGTPETAKTAGTVDPSASHK